MTPSDLIGQITNTQTVNSIAVLKTVSSATSKGALLTGYYTSGDGGGGTYAVDPTDITSADNGGTIIVATDGARWKLSTKNASVRQFGAKGDGVADDTDAFNRCIEWHRINGSEVYIPTGTYSCTNILFGTQSTTSQSSHPVGIYGDGWGSVIYAKAGVTGTLFKGWSLAGCHMRKFQVIVNSASNVVPFDVRWMAGPGPSAQNRFEHIRITGGTNPIVATFDDNNDSVLSQVHCNGSSPTQYVSMVASGGLFSIDSCIWNQIYLKFGCQNGQISNSWGMGICFAAGTLNYVYLNSLYLYPNTHSGHILWSESFSSYQSVHALTATACQFIGETPAGAFNLNLFSKFKMEGCQFIYGAPGSTMFGPNCTRDAYSLPVVEISGGSYPSNFLTLNWPGAFRKSISGLMDDYTGIMQETVNEDTQIFVSTGVPAYTAGDWLTVVPTGTIYEAGLHSVSVEWNHVSAGLPYLVTVGGFLAITGQNAAGNFGSPVNAAISIHLDAGTSTASLRTITAGGGAMSGVQVKSNVSWGGGGTLKVRVRKL